MLIGFGVIGFIVLVGYIVAVTGILGEHPRFVLSRLVFYVLAPSLLFTVLADADVATLFSSVLGVAATSAAIAIVVFVLVVRLLWKRSVGETVIGAASASYVNANNIGIPVAVYVVGDASLSAPVILMQLIVLAPIILTILDVVTSGRPSLGRILLQPLRNPLIIGSALGVLVSVTGVELPAPVMEPFRLIGAAAVPVVLLAFGISLHGQRVLEAGTKRRDVVLASAIKLAVMPLAAWFFGGVVFGLEGQPLFAVVLLAALPTGQNVFVYAQRYEQGETIARDTMLITTIGSVPVLLVAAALLT